MNNFLKLNNLSKNYEKNKSLKVLNNINFKFESGKVYSIIGPSGSGKSTLLNLLSFIDIPSSGFIEFNKKKIESALSLLDESDKKFKGFLKGSPWDSLREVVFKFV